MLQVQHRQRLIANGRPGVEKELDPVCTWTLWYNRGLGMESVLLLYFVAIVVEIGSVFAEVYLSR